MSEEQSLDTHLSMLKATLANVESELMKLSAGNKSSTPRLRKFLMDLKNQAHLMRGASTNYLKSLPKKTKVPTNRTLEKKTEVVVESKPEIVPLAVEPAHSPESEPQVESQPVAKKARVRKPSAKVLSLTA